MCKMSLNFSANLSTMFLEFDLKDRFEKAKEYGFSSFEMQNPYDFSPEILSSYKKDLKCDLINIYCETPFGCAALPVHENEFFMATQKIIPYYNSLGFKKLHILSGIKSPSFTKEDQMTTFVENLKSLVNSDFLENINVTGLIEPISAEVCEDYYLNSFELAVDIIKEVNSDQIKLLLDVYHLHNITGDVPKYLELYYPYSGHIQISDAPGRKEPFSDGGKIDYDFVLEFLKKQQHKDVIGLEYSPSGSTAESLAWMKKYI